MLDSLHFGGQGANLDEQILPKQCRLNTQSITNIYSAESTSCGKG